MCLHIAMVAYCHLLIFHSYVCCKWILIKFEETLQSCHGMMPPPCSTPWNCLQFDIVIISVLLFSIASMNGYGAMAMLSHIFFFIHEREKL